MSHDDPHPSEFALIERYFQHKTPQRADVVLGIGDDAALLQLPPQTLMAVAMDTMVAGRHFPLHTHPADIGYKALAVNLSDLAAMAAEPVWLTLALTMPESDNLWLQQFTDGLFQLARRYGMQLIGGDTTRGPLTVTIQAHGFVPRELALTRGGAKAGDKIYVSGTLGDAGLGLRVVQGEIKLPNEDTTFLSQRLNRPEPRVELGMKLRGMASSAIDISDGLLADLQHILDASQVGAVIHADRLPLSSSMKNNIRTEDAKRLALTAGDDYELCFTIPEQHAAEFNALNLHCTCIGEITQHSGLKLHGYEGEIKRAGYQHFL